MEHVPSIKFRLMSPQWLVIKERKEKVSKDKRPQCNIDEDETVLLFDNRTRRFTIKNDLKMLVPVLAVTGIKNYQSFQLPFVPLGKMRKIFNAYLKTTSKVPQLKKIVKVFV